MKGYLGGPDKAALDIAEAIGLKIEGLKAFCLHCNADTVATIYAEYYAFNPVIEELTTIFKEYNLIEKKETIPPIPK